MYLSITTIGCARTSTAVPSPGKVRISEATLTSHSLSRRTVPLHNQPNSIHHLHGQLATAGEQTGGATRSNKHHPSSGFSSDAVPIPTPKSPSFQEGSDPSVNLELPGCQAADVPFRLPNRDGGMQDEGERPGWVQSGPRGCKGPSREVESPCR